jgi:phage recombination protein Bet
MSNQSQEIIPWEKLDANQYLVSRGINQSCWSALCNTLYPSNKADSVILAWEYCEARGLDIMMKPVHLVPMNVKNPHTGQKEWRDVVMPGVGLYRIQADRSKTYAGADEPEFGPLIVRDFIDGYNENKTITVSYPEWCKYTVHKLIGDRIVAFSAKEYWTENYATMKAGSDCPNAMWQKRPNGQLAKCTEAQALRKAWPEIGQEATAEEMMGKDFHSDEKDITPSSPVPVDNNQLVEMVTQGIKAIEMGKKTPEQIIKFIKNKKLDLSTEQEATLLAVKVAA